MSDTAYYILGALVLATATTQALLLLWFLRDGERRMQALNAEGERRMLAVFRDIGLGVARIDERLE